MFDAIATVLAWFYELWPSYGMAIVFLTLAVMVILTPLTLKGTRSMMAMQKLQPEMKKIQQKYKGDRQKLNEEMMKFYQEHKINPVGGCLPLLLQIPVFIVLYRVLSGLTRRGENDFFDPSYLDQDSDLRRALEGSKEMISWGIDLSESARDALAESFGHGLPYLALIGIVGLTGWYQQRQTMARRAPGVEINPQQQAIMRFMPLLLPVISFTIPAGVVVYFLVSNLYRIAQQAYIQRTTDFTGGGGTGGPARRAVGTGDGKANPDTRTETKNEARPAPSNPSNPSNPVRPPSAARRRKKRRKR